MGLLDKLSDFFGRRTIKIERTPAEGGSYTIEIDYHEMQEPHVLRTIREIVRHMEGAAGDPLVLGGGQRTRILRVRGDNGK